MSTSAESYPPLEQWQGRPSRIWLVGLLLFGALFTPALLFARFQFEDFRAGLQRKVEERLSRYFASESISLEGIRGVRIKDFGVDFTSTTGTRVELQAPTALFLVDVLDLTEGVLTVDRVELDGATVRLTKSDSPPPTAALSPAHASGLITPGAFRIVGKGCRIELNGFVAERDFVLDSVDLDAYRLAGAPDFQATVSAVLQEPAPVSFHAKGRFVSPEDFDLTAELTDEVTADTVNALLQKPQPYIVGGAIVPVITAQARPGKPLKATVDATFTGLSVQGQPEELGPSSGTLAALATFDRSTKQLQIERAEITSPRIAATARGIVALDPSGPRLDISAEATRLPTDLVAPYLEKSPLSQYGKAEIALKEPYRVSVTAKGEMAKPELTAYVSAAGGTVAFTPTNKQWPKGELELGMLEASWDSTSRQPQGTLNIESGTIVHGETKMKAEDVSGRVRFAGKKLTVYPLQAQITGNVCAASIDYDFEAQDARMTVAGALSEIEKTPLSTVIENTVLSGTAAIRGSLVKKSGKYTVQADLDLTQTDVAYRWYFRKEPGVGGVARFDIDFVPKKGASIQGDLVVASSPIKASMDFGYTGKKYRLKGIQASSDRLDISALGRCILIPYRISGGMGTDAHYTWTRRSVERRSWVSQAVLRIDEIFLQPEGKNALMHIKDASVQIDLDKDSTPANGKLVLKAAEGYMPSLREEWFVPIEPDRTIWKDYRPEFQHWTYRLAADKLETPPWKGTNFTGEGYSNPKESGLRNYAADIDGGGRIQGSYTRNRPDNSYTTTIDWDGVPATYFLEHLRMSPYLTGESSGEITYFLDRDDPNTLKGSGRFAVKNGKFSEEFLYSKLQGNNPSEPMALPPSLRFSSLTSSIDFQGDIVRTPDLVLQSEGISVNGAGQFITDGDMDYDIRVSIKPEMAERIPMLTQYFNVEGHRLAQQDIQLAFKVTGPTGGPKGQLAGSPTARVTLVSGALEMTSEAIKVIDTPRKILVDLLKLGGGLVGATK